MYQNKTCMQFFLQAANEIQIGQKWKEKKSVRLFLGTYILMPEYLLESLLDVDRERSLKHTTFIVKSLLGNTINAINNPT